MGLYEWLTLALEALGVTATMIMLVIDWSQKGKPRKPG